MAEDILVESESFKAFRLYLEAVNPQKGGKVGSYLQVIRKLGKILNSHQEYSFVPDDFSEIKNLTLLQQIYQFIVEEQKKPDGGVFNGSELTKSYWGNGHGFCSAAVKSFIEYRVKTYDGLVNVINSMPFQRGAQMNVSQLIIYGAPGTGKSHKIDKCTKESNSIRVTFHPDTDYAAFVGAYKPTMVGHRKQVILDYENLVDKFKEYLSVQPTNVTRACALFGYDYHDSIKDMTDRGHTIPELVNDAYKSGSTYDSVVRAGMSVYEQSPSETESISYSFVPQAFMKAYVEAWRRWSDASLDSDAKTYYLVIEEINRGNCAQIFGDLFQLLDRADNGFSAYAITPDDDIQKFLEKDKDYKLADIPFADDIKKMTEDGEKVIATAADIKVGKKLVLPPNLCIWATMNTSDQSLFPMDSAFKRRWDWKYVPIKDAAKGWKIKFGDCEVDWWKFLVAINKVVKSVTNSADKQMGYFFVRAKDSVIDAEMFVNKVAFYLWNDVFKDCELDGDAFKITREGDEVDVLAFRDFFKEDGTVNEEVLKNFLTVLVPPPEAAPDEPDAEPAAGGEV